MWVLSCLRRVGVNFGGRPARDRSCSELPSSSRRFQSMTVRGAHLISLQILLTDHPSCSRVWMRRRFLTRSGTGPICTKRDCIDLFLCCLTQLYCRVCSVLLVPFGSLQFCRFCRFCSNGSIGFTAISNVEPLLTPPTTRRLLPWEALVDHQHMTECVYV
jgi:hypothetical protein